MKKLEKVMVGLMLSVALMVMVGCSNNAGGDKPDDDTGSNAIVNTDFIQSVAGREVTLQKGNTSTSSSIRSLNGISANSRVGTTDEASFSNDGKTLTVGVTNYTFDDANSTTERGIYVNGNDYYILLLSSGTFLSHVTPDVGATFSGMPDAGTMRKAAKHEAPITGFTDLALAMDAPPSTFFLTAVSG